MRLEQRSPPLMGWEQPPSPPTSQPADQVYLRGTGAGAVPRGAQPTAFK